MPHEEINRLGTATELDVFGHEVSNTNRIGVFISISATGLRVGQSFNKGDRYQIALSLDRRQGRPYYRVVGGRRLPHHNGAEVPPDHSHYNYFNAGDVVTFPEFSGMYLTLLVRQDGDRYFFTVIFHSE